MCGILGVVAHSPVNQLLYDGTMRYDAEDATHIYASVLLNL